MRSLAARSWTGGFGLVLALLLGAVTPRTGLQGAEIKWASSFRTAMEQARSEQKFVMVDFYTGWCTWCKVMDAQTFPDTAVVPLASKMVSVKVNAESERTLAQQYGIRAFPTVVFLNPDGSLRERVQGFKPPNVFAPILSTVLEVDSELYGLRRQVQENPKDSGLRRALALALALSGEYRSAAAQLDTVLTDFDGDKETLADLQLDRLIYLHRAGETKDIRKQLEKWVKKAKNHPRRTEGQYYQAMAEARDGREKKARKILEEIRRGDPGTWYAEVARDRLGGT